VTAPRVAILADDLIWQTRLAEAVRSIGATADRTRSQPELGRALDRADALIVDLTARSYDGVSTIEMARRLRPALPILAVGQHDDVAVRKRALAAGADRVLAYRKLFEDGPATLERWLAGAAAGAPAER
jgi:DNA-binding response OmpR family regulator